MACTRRVGCHACIIEQLEEDMRLFRAQVVQFLREPSVYQQRMKEQALAMKRKIDDWYEPKGIEE